MSVRYPVPLPLRPRTGLPGTWNTPLSTSGSHDASGSLLADAAVVSGAALHPHTSSGALAAQAAAVAGDAERSTPSTEHDTSGALSADAATLEGTAVHLTLHATTGALAAQDATVSGAATHLTLHTTTGSLVADAATISGLSSLNGAVEARQTGGGSAPAKRQQRRRYLVEIDGEEFQVFSPEEADDVLSKTREAAQEVATRVVARAVRATQRPIRKVLQDARKALVLPEIKTDAPIDVAAVMAEINAIYADAMKRVERIREDEDDDLLVMLL